MSWRDEFREYALRFDGAWLDPAWEIEGDVFKTANGKIFLIVAPGEGAVAVTIKLPAGDAAEALTLPFVRQAAWPRGWLTAAVTGQTERDIALEWVSRSFVLASARK